MATPEIRPLVSPAAASPASRKWAVLVLPLVPVTPWMRSSRAGKPWNHALSGALTARGSGTTREGSSVAGRSLIATTAPACAARSSKSSPWCRPPGSAR